VNKLAEKPFALIGVNGNNDAKKLKKIMEQEKLNWRSFADQGAIAAKWNASTPAYYLIDHHGVIRHKWVGRPGPGERVIDAAIAKAMQEAAKAPK
jgi:peroxiredoxin